MYHVELNWDMLLRTVLPFVAANIFLMVLVYFTLVRDRIGKAYPFYCLFIICFIIFLCGPLINIMPLNEARRGYDIVRNVLLFTVGIPCLLYALFLQAKQHISKFLLITPVILGFAWCCGFIVAAPLYQYHPSELPWLISVQSIDHQIIYLSQLVLIIIQLLVPCILLLGNNLKPYVATQVYGAITLSFFMCLGNAFELWIVYYAGASLSAIIWARAVFNDVKFTNAKIHRHTKHHQSLALAQFTANNERCFSQYYPYELNNTYPLKERDALLEVIGIANPDLAKAKLDELLLKLKSYSKNTLSCYQHRAKEVAFMMFDQVIFHCGNNKYILDRLESAGNSLHSASSIADIDRILHHSVDMIATTVSQLSTGSPEQQLVDKVKVYILNRYHHDITVADIVSAVGASRSYTMKNFKQLTSTTINQYLVNVRIEHAKSILLSKNVTETAYAVGFNNSAYFSTVFKKYTQLSPKQYQDKCSVKS
ncbi:MULTISPECIES: helix-turn-helix transcriptional regulator [unclassified Shewanella]|uniref:helix-turn-helix transcriptional regulator n=1 Tax=unclassified Shewanella TaxID=196818 RepID=UPI000C851CD2|nr:MULTISPECIES: AraC family transcriptional regulator [unclassified Shewanella]MDO6776162.1 AraC family transcriptional regulator [Shewanella sp. 3_MG-2023]PMI02114.1 transcriptional regulator [Shewanella sp. 10N.286.48.A6]